MPGTIVVVSGGSGMGGGAEAAFFLQEKPSARKRDMNEIAKMLRPGINIA